MTRFAVVSDLHANVEALQAVFARIDALGIEDVVCLGDIVGYGAEPEIAVEMVMRRCRWSIVGNHDHGLFHGDADFHPLAAEALEYTRRRLRPRWFRLGRRRAWEYLRNLPPRKEEGGILFVHGSPRDPVMEYVLKSDGFLEPEKMRGIFGLIDQPCFVGHTHWPGWHDRSFRFTQATDDVRTLRLTGEPVIVNVGSVGQPRDGDSRACFVVVDDATVTWHRVAYDFRRTQAKILAAGLHPALAERLARGK